MAAITFDYNTAMFRTLAKTGYDWIARIGHAVHDYHVRAKAERELKAMDSHLLADIGIHRGDIHARVWGKM